MFLSVIIPAYNEKKRLPLTLEKVRKYLSTQSYDWEVIIVNDGSTDQTVEVVKKLLSYEVMKGLNFRLIDNKKNCGKGAVVKQGMLAAKGEWRLFMDADGSTDISEIEKLWKFVKNGLGASIALSHPIHPSPPAASAPTPAASGHRLSLKDAPSADTIYEIIIGSRYLKGDSIKIKQPLGRRIISRLGNILVRLLLGIKSADTQCGFKLFSAEAAEKIFPLQTIKRWGFDMEILAIAIRKGYKIKEVSVDWFDVEGSNVKSGAAFKTLKELLIIKRNIVFRKYT